jgi:hypothetical protein
MLGYQNNDVAAWPVRRCFAVTEQTFSVSQFLQKRLSFVPLGTDQKKRFYPQDVFTSEFMENCTPRTIFFSEIANNKQTLIAPLSPAQMISRLIRMSPWSCYDKSTAREHLSTLARLVRQCKGFDLFAGRDLLAPGNSSNLLASYVHD